MAYHACRVAFTATLLLACNGDKTPVEPTDWSQGDWVVQTVNGQQIPAIVNGQTFTYLRIVNSGETHRLTARYMYSDGLGNNDVNCDGPADIGVEGDTLYVSIGGINLNYVCTFQMQRVSNGKAMLRWLRYDAVLKRQ